MRTSSATRSASRSATSDDAARRTGAPFSPAWLTNGGSHSSSDTWPRGEWSAVTASTGSPVSRPAATSGSETVAEARTKVGDAPYIAHTRRSRRSTCETCAPKTPR